MLTLLSTYVSVVMFYVCLLQQASIRVMQEIHSNSVLSRLFLEDAAPPYCPNIPPINVSEAAAPPIKVMVAKLICIQQLLPNSYTHASTQQPVVQ